jgi:hypothetical protein
MLTFNKFTDWVSRKYQFINSSPDGFPQVIKASRTNKVISNIKRADSLKQVQIRGNNPKPSIINPTLRHLQTRDTPNPLSHKLHKNSLQLLDPQPHPRKIIAMFQRAVNNLLNLFLHHEQMVVVFGGQRDRLFGLVQGELDCLLGGCEMLLDC